MKNYRITVNGVAYDVAVEEIGADEMTVATPAAAAAKVPEKKASEKKVVKAAGEVKINAPMPGKIVAVKVKSGDNVSKGDVLVVLEAMKMENEICAPQDGVVASVEVLVGDMVESASILATMN